MPTLGYHLDNSGSQQIECCSGPETFTRMLTALLVQHPDYLLSVRGVTSAVLFLECVTSGRYSIPQLSYRPWVPKAQTREHWPRPSPAVALPVVLAALSSSTL